MKRRTRTSAGLLALVALTASFSEAVAASICASPARMEAMPSMAMPMEDEESGEDHGMACAGMRHTDHRRGGGERCPLTPTATQGCSAPASAPAPPVSVGVAAQATVAHVPFDAVERGLLFAEPLHRPPRA